MIIPRKCDKTKEGWFKNNIIDTAILFLFADDKALNMLTSNPSRGL